MKRSSDPQNLDCNNGVGSLPGGQGFVDLLVGYIDANVLIHKNSHQLTLVPFKVRWQVATIMG